MISTKLFYIIVIALLLFIAILAILIFLLMVDRKTLKRMNQQLEDIGADVSMLSHIVDQLDSDTKTRFLVLIEELNKPKNKKKNKTEKSGE